MKKKHLLSILISAAILSACGSGSSNNPPNNQDNPGNPPNNGDSGNGGGNDQPTIKFPVGKCFAQGGNYLSPSIYSNPLVESNYIYYSYESNESGIYNLQIAYREQTEKHPKNSDELTYKNSVIATFYFLADSLKTLPTGVCAIDNNLSPNGINSKKYRGDIMYITDCKAKLDGSQLSFSGNYDIYNADLIPVTGISPGSLIQSGEINFTCNKLFNTGQ